MVNTNIYKYFRNNRGFFLPIIKLIQLFFKINQYWAFRPLKHGFLPISVYTISSGCDKFIHDTGYLVCRFLSNPTDGIKNIAGRFPQNMQPCQGSKPWQGCSEFHFIMNLALRFRKRPKTTGRYPLFEWNKFF